MYPWISIFLSFCPIRLQKKIILQLSSSLLLSSKNSPSFVVFALHLILREGRRKSGGQTGSQLRSPPKILLMSRTLGPWGCMKWVTQLGKTFETKLTLAVDSKRQRRFTLLKSRKVQLLSDSLTLDTFLNWYLITLILSLSFAITQFDFCLGPEIITLSDSKCILVLELWVQLWTFRGPLVLFPCKSVQQIKSSQSRLVSHCPPFLRPPDDNWGWHWRENWSWWRTTAARKHTEVQSHLLFLFERFDRDCVVISVRGLPFRTSAKISDFFRPQIHATSLTKVAYYVCFWRYPPPPLSADVLYGSPPVAGDV